MPSRKLPPHIQAHLGKGLRSAGKTVSRQLGKASRKAARKGDIVQSSLLSFLTGMLDSAVRAPDDGSPAKPKDLPRRPGKVVGHTTITVDGVPQQAEILDPIDETES